MQDKDIERAIENAAASVEMEGYHINEQCREWGRLLLRDEITMNEYIQRVMQKSGVFANFV